jgi:signal transduction histidine kinase
MRFTSTIIKLTAFYVGIIMLISISFSIAIYKISQNELGRGLNRQNGLFRDTVTSQLLPDRYEQLEVLRQQQYEESSHRLAINLIYFNLLILIAGAVGSYLFAQKTLEPIEEALEAQNRFTADASHELRTPLAAMKSEIEVYLRDKQATLDQSKKLLESNLEEIGKLEILSTSLLKLARSENTEQKFLFENISEILVDAYEKVAVMAEKKEIVFENKLENVEVIGDRTRLVELFVILLDNAIKYSPEKSKIKIDVYSLKNQVMVSVKDHGIGIKASDIPYIFNRFYRADTSRCKEQVCGYGLGLSIAKKIVESHRGEIAVSSKPGKGTLFKVILPKS